MQNATIKREHITVTTTPTHGLNQSCMTIAAALVYGLTALVDRDTLVDNEQRKENIGTMGDRWYAGCLRLALHVAPMVDDAIDWPDFHDEHGGVFTYEFVEVAHGVASVGDAELNLTVALFEAITDEAWYQICENLRLPTAESVRAVIEGWAARTAITLNPV